MKRTLSSIGLGLAFFSATHGHAQSDAAMMLAPWDEGQRAQLDAEGFYTPTEAGTTGADVDLSIFDASGRVRLKPGASYDPTIGFEFTQFEMASSDAALPDDMTDVSVAFGGRLNDVELGEALGGTWQMGYTLGVGYSGTNVFGDSDGYYAKADLYAINPIDKDTRWVVGLNYDGNRVFLPDVPLPAVTYFGRLNDELTYGLGFPFSRLDWRPTDRWHLTLRSAVFFSFNAKARYRATDKLELFAAYVRRTDAFTASGGIDHRRFLFSQQRAELGLAYDLLDNTALTVAGGFAFDQEIDFGYDTRDPSSLRDLDDSGYLRAAVEFKF